VACSAYPTVREIFINLPSVYDREPPPLDVACYESP
jgi:hypothetical protein